jgi:hypothetical protein
MAGRSAAAALKRKADKSEITAIEERLRSGHDVSVFMGAYTYYESLDFRALELKKDHEARPFWVCPNGQVFLEEYSPRYKQARDFLVQIAEPCSRPFYIHEYRLEKNALFAAASMGFTADTIIAVLDMLSKTPVAETVKAFIKDCTVGYGKVKLVLSRGKYYLESNNAAILRQLNADETVKRARVKTVQVCCHVLRGKSTLYRVPPVSCCVGLRCAPLR